jgi:type II secretory pathway pseudopilin PulG
MTRTHSTLRRPLPRSPGACARRTFARAFTAIEVLIAMTIMFIGAAAVMTMQKTAIQGDLDARKADVASAIAHTWVERIRHWSMRWTQPTASNLTSNLSSVPGLGHIDGGWFRPSDEMLGNLAQPGTVETMSYGFDILGRDLAQADIAANVQFCAEARITTLVPTTIVAAVPPLPGTVTSGIYRVDVRVVWPRGIATVPNATVSGSLKDWPCTLPSKTFPDYPLFDYTLYRAISVTTAIVENPAE